MSLSLISDKGLAQTSNSEMKRSNWYACWERGFIMDFIIRKIKYMKFHKFLTYQNKTIKPVVDGIENRK